MSALVRWLLTSLCIAGAILGESRAEPNQPCIEAAGTSADDRALAQQVLDALENQRLGKAASAAKSWLAWRERTHGERSVPVAEVLACLGSIRADMRRERPAAMRDLARAQTIWEASGPAGELRVAETLMAQGNLHEAEGARELAQHAYQRAYDIRARVPGVHPALMASSLGGLAAMREAAFEWAQAIADRERIVDLFSRHQPAEADRLAVALSDLAETLTDAGRTDDALARYTQAHRLTESLPGAPPARLAQSLSNRGVAFMRVSRYPEALADLEAAHAIKLGLPEGVAKDLGVSYNNLGAVYAHLGRYGQAWGAYESALSLRRLEGPDSLKLAETLSNFGVLKLRLGQAEHSVPLLEQARAIRQSHQQPSELERVLVEFNLAAAYTAAGRYEQALEIQGRLFALQAKHGAMGSISLAALLSARGGTYEAMGRHQQALADYLRVLDIERANSAKNVQRAWAMNNAAATYLAMGRPEQAWELLRQALPLAVSNADPDLTWRIYARMAAVHAARGEWHLAVYWGKLAVNTLQGLRASLPAGGEVDPAFLQSKQWVYLDLIKVLVDQGRLGESNQVTAMLKEQEMFELLRSDAVTDPRASKAGLSGIETSQQQAYERLTQDLAAAGQQLDALQRKANAEPLSIDDQALKTAQEVQLKNGQTAFERYLSDLEAAFAKISDNKRRKDIERLNVAEAQALQSTLDELGHGAVLLHYIVLDDQLKIILTTPTIQRGYTVKVGQKALNQAINFLREGIERRVDVQLSAKQLYDWLIGPVQADLDSAGAQTVMVALTDALRYLPFAALHDGKQWLAQRYALAMYTEAARDKIAKASNPKWQLQAFGVSRQIPGFKALPAVKAELASIIGSQGIPGQSRLDEQFTAGALQSAVDARPSVIHVASHFVFRPGTEIDSFLLLGDGNRLTLADIKGYSFRQLDLLTLSACETALGGGQNENGREIEGLGALAQRRGAGAVLATLWPIANDSTTQFMQRFYTTRQSQPGMSKAEAIRQAQRAMIEGLPEAHPDAQEGRANAPMTGAEPTARQASRPGGVARTHVPLAIDPARPYAHPYFWAPFVLMGTWL